jgi:hypothetical protein
MGTFYLLIFSLILGFSCGRHHDSHFDYEDKEEFFYQEEMRNAQGKYIVNFNPLNRKRAGTHQGQGLIWVRGNYILVQIKLQGGAPRVEHAQYLHSRARCPGMDDDFNGDGFLDDAEGALVFGERLIPLDKDMGSLKRGIDVFPRSNSQSAYIYEEETVFSDMLEDLRNKNTYENLGRLATGEQLGLLGRSIVIYGSEHIEDLPIACGIIKKLGTP